MAPKLSELNKSCLSPPRRLPSRGLYLLLLLLRLPCLWEESCEQTGGFSRFVLTLGLHEHLLPLRTALCLPSPGLDCCYLSDPHTSLTLSFLTWTLTLSPTLEEVLDVEGCYLHLFGYHNHSAAPVSSLKIHWGRRCWERIWTVTEDPTWNPHSFPLTRRTSTRRDLADTASEMNSVCQLDGATGCPGTWPNVILGISVKQAALPN